MSEWWTYRPGDFLMFSARAYAGLVERYNADVWPLHVLTVALALGALGLVLRPGRQARDRIVSAVLAGSWLWVGWAFQYRRFAMINWAAEYVAWTFAVQGLALIWLGVVRGRLVYRYQGSPRCGVGLSIAAGAVVAYPLLAVLLGRPWMRTEVVGIMPDPTAFATLGFLLLAQPLRPWLMLVPLGYCALSGATLLTLDAVEGWLPLLVAALAIGFGWPRRVGSAPRPQGGVP